MKQLLSFPIDKVFPCVDLYRLYVTHASSQSEFTKSDQGMEHLAVMLRLLTTKGAPEPVYMLACRALCNFFRHQSSNHTCLMYRSKVIDAVSPHLSAGKPTTRQAAVSLLLNYSIDF